MEEEKDMMRDDENTHVQTLNGHIYSLKYLFVIFK